MTYVDVMLAAVPTDAKEKYLEYARSMTDVVKANGALSMVDCWGNDVPDGKVTSLPMAVKTEPGETVVVGWITWPSKETRDAAWKVMMEDPGMSQQKNPMPFDGKRMIFGGFEVISEV